MKHRLLLLLIAIFAATTVAVALAPKPPASQETHTPKPKPKPKPKPTPKLPEIEMIRVEGGTFSMGSDDSDANSAEKPVHSVTVPDFQIGKYEVTQKLWKAVMGTNPSYHKGDSLPVTNVSWKDVQTFIRKLNKRTGKNYRLPTEAEWEFAARGGNASCGYKYSGSDNLNAIAWYYDNSNLTPHPVGTKAPNELGIYDMTGNISEWVSDVWCDDYSSPRSGSRRVFRGGGWGGNARICRVSRRYYLSPDYRYDDLGFRLAL